MQMERSLTGTGKKGLGKATASISGRMVTSTKAISNGTDATATGYRNMPMAVSTKETGGLESAMVKESSRGRTGPFKRETGQVAN